MAPNPVVHGRQTERVAEDRHASRGVGDLDAVRAVGQAAPADGEVARSAIDARGFQIAGEQDEFVGGRGAGDFAPEEAGLVVDGGEPFEDQAVAFLPEVAGGGVLTEHKRCADLQGHGVDLQDLSGRQVLTGEGREGGRVAVGAEGEVVVELEFGALLYGSPLQQRRAVLPSEFAVLGDFKEFARAAAADEVATVAEALEGAQAAAGQSRLGVGPLEVVRSPALEGGVPFIAAIVLVEDGGDHRRFGVEAGGVDVGDAVVEDEEAVPIGVARVHSESVAPVDVVLVEQALVSAVPAVVGLRISPAPNEVVVELVIVPDDPDFVEGRDAHDDLARRVVEGEVIDRIHVQPVGRLGTFRAEVEVNLVLLVGNDPVVGLGAVEVLNEVVPGAPLPDNVGTALAVRLELDELVAPQFTPGEEGGVAAVVDALEAVEDLPADGDHIAAGHHGEVVVQAQAVVVGREAPQNLVVPSAALDGGPAATGPDGVVAD